MEGKGRSAITDPLMHDFEKDTRITRLLEDWCDGHGQALDQIVSQTYGRLRRLATKVMVDERQGHTLQPTELVHEVWQRLAQANDRPALNDRRHFYNVAARVMRRILVDHARRKATDRRGGAVIHTDLDPAIAEHERDRVGMLTLDQALRQLEQIDPRRTRVVELHCFAGLTLDETAEALEVSQVTVCRDWRLARAFLRSRLNADREATPSKKVGMSAKT